MEAQMLTFSLIDKSSGYEATPKRVKLELLARFTAEVSELIRGSQREIDPANIDVSLRTGSIAIRTEPIALAPTLFRDLRALQETELLDAVDPKRRAVVEQWQKRASQAPAVAYEISAPFLPGKIAISARSDYRANDADQWVAVERYVTGEVQNVGGASRPNAHIKLPDGTTLIVATERGVLKDDPQNRIYKKATLRIRARYNVLTRELKDAQLLEFVEYAPRFDEEEMERLAERGEQAWKDVEDATAWVDELRGHD